jgi:adenylate kinase
MLNIVLFGPPGAGKGTQSEKLIAAYHLVHLSTGDLLRSEIAAGTELGLEAKKLMDAGILVPDEVVIGMIRSKLDQNKYANGFIFDGFPRTTAQAEALDKLLAEKDRSITMMLALEVSDEELTKRLLLRGQESGRPDDKNEDIIRKRIQEYNNKTAPLRDYYAAQNKFKSVHGMGTIEEIFDALCAAINFTESEVPASEHRPADEAMASKIKGFVTEVFTNIKNTVEKTPAKKNIAKKTPAKKVEKKAVKKTASNIVKKAAPKKAKKVTVKKITKVAAKKVAPKKKVAKKVAKKPAPKKIAKKIAPKKVAAKKTSVKKAIKKTTKKVVKKASVKKVAKKISAKKPVIKKAVSKKVAGKKAAKKIVKRAAPKKASKTVKKVVKKTAAKRRK